MKKDAYYTVEATFVVTICIWVLMALLYTGLYVHDRLVLETVTAGQTSAWVNMDPEKKYSEGKFKKKLKKSLKKKLFILPVHGVDISSGITTKKVSVRYSLPISLSLLKRIWTGEDGDTSEEAEVVDINPARIKWDADEVRRRSDG